MKKTLSVILSICIFISLFSFTGCTSKKSKYIQAKQKLGMIDENGKEVGDSVAGEPEEISEAINILNDLGDYEDSVELESKASDYYYGDLAYKALNDYDFDKAEEYFKKTKVNCPDRFLMAIPLLKKYIGTWEGSLGDYDSVTVKLSGPFIPFKSPYNDCDWRIEFKAEITVSKTTSYPHQNFTIYQNCGLDHMKGADSLSPIILILHDKFGENVLSYRRGIAGYSRIGLQEDNGSFWLSENICNLDFTTVYASNALKLHKVS